MLWVRLVVGGLVEVLAKGWVADASALEVLVPWTVLLGCRKSVGLG